MIVVLTGAGVSAESGLGTFRDLGGIWQQVRLEEVATPEAFAADPARVHAFYNARRAQAAQAQPNAAHRALARLEAAGALARLEAAGALIVTQNVDDLHERGGARNVIHMHGQLNQSLCAHCGARAPCARDLSTDDTCPDCGQTGGLRPDVVWFGEMPYHMDRIHAALGACDLFVSIGTSGTVYPAAGFVAHAREAGARTLELNLEPTGNPDFHAVETGPATRTVPAMVDRYLAGDIKGI